MLRETVALATALTLTAAPPAWTDPWGDIDCAQGTTPACELTAGTVHHHEGSGHHTTDAHPPSANGQEPFPSCRYVPVNHEVPAPRPEEPGGWFMVLCSPDGKDPDSHGPVWVPAGRVPVVSPAELARTARERLRLPAPQIERSPAKDQLVHLPTWLWLSGGWQPVSATASVPGLSVTAVATPLSVAWSMGDGSTVTCDGPGTRYQTVADPKATSPDCGHIYRRSSANQTGQAFAVTATVHWTVAWSGAGQSGVFSNMTTTDSTRLRVAQSQALNNGG